MISPTQQPKTSQIERAIKEHDNQDNISIANIFGLNQSMQQQQDKDSKDSHKSTNFDNTIINDDNQNTIINEEQDNKGNIKEEEEEKQEHTVNTKKEEENKENKEQPEYKERSESEIIEGLTTAKNMAFEQMNKFYLNTHIDKSPIDKEQTKEMLNKHLSGKRNTFDQIKDYLNSTNWEKYIGVLTPSVTGTRDIINEKDIEM
ncbi:hypothetical protein ABK040_008333 [Willaertia magna]